jgi:sensor domain CHASE-containing protein
LSPNLSSLIVALPLVFDHVLLDHKNRREQEGLRENLWNDLVFVQSRMESSQLK